MLLFLLYLQISDTAAVFSPNSNMNAMIFLAHIVLYDALVSILSCLYSTCSCTVSVKTFFLVQCYSICEVKIFILREYCNYAQIWTSRMDFFELLVSWLKPYLGIGVAIHA